jgi:hypothetical protein
VGYIDAKMSTMTRQQVLDMYFMDARHKLIDLAAFLDRVDRAPGENDFRMEALKEALKHLEASEGNRAAKVLMTFSDPTKDPIPAANDQGRMRCMARKHQRLNQVKPRRSTCVILNHMATWSAEPLTIT